MDELLIEYADAFPCSASHEALDAWMKMMTAYRNVKVLPRTYLVVETCD